MSRFFLFTVCFLVCASCSFFPGFIQPWANKVAGIGGQGIWSTVGDPSFSQPVLSDASGKKGLTWDLAVSPQGRVLTGMVSYTDTRSYVYEYLPGAGWFMLGGNPVSTWQSSSYNQMSVTYVFDGAEYIPYTGMAFQPAGYANTILYVHPYDLGGGFWSGSVLTLTNYTQIDLLKSTRASVDGPGLWYKDGAGITALSNIPGYVGYLAFGPVARFFKSAFDPLSGFQALIAGNSAVMETFWGAGGQSITKKGLSLSNMGVEEAGFILSSARPPLHMLVAYYTGTSVRIDSIDSVSHVTVTNFSPGDIYSMDADYDHNRQAMYLALARSDNQTVVLYRYDEGSETLTQVGSPLPHSAQNVKVRLKPGSTEVYVGLVDFSDDKVKIFKILD